MILMTHDRHSEYASGAGKIEDFLSLHPAPCWNMEGGGGS